MIKKFCHEDNDLTSVKRVKLMVLLVSAWCSICGIAWSGIYYLVFGFSLTTLLPLLFAIVVIPSIFISHYRKNYRILLKTLLFSITFIPTLIQWSLGSINNSGFVIAWVFLAPLGGLLFINEKAAKFWMIIFLLILGITIFVTPAFTADAVCLDSEIRNLFYLQNTGMVFSVIFILLIFYYRNLISEKGTNYIAKELRQFIETANAPIFGIDSQGMVNEWNQAAAKITGFSKSEVLGQDLVKTYITEDYQEQVKQVLDNALKGEETANYEFPLFTKDDKRVMVLLNSSTRRDAEGNVVGVLGVGQDITEMDALRTALNDYKEDLEAKIIKNVKERTKELEGALEREKELGLLKSSFVSMASHQFRTPLAVIQSNAQLFEMLQSSNKEVGPEKYIKITDRITGEITKMTTLMDDVLILGKLTSGNVPFDPRELDLVEFCNLTIYQFNLIQKDGRRLDFVVKGKPYNVEIDAKLLEHSLSNLISNAFKYSIGKENPKLKVTYEAKGFSLTVTDSGIGVPKEDMNDLMQPFFRSNNSIGINGTGLGLSIAKEYIEVNKGTLCVNSTEGVGSSFEMKFKKS